MRCMQEQDLLPLPPGTPELIAITCNTKDNDTRTGTFVVRTRTVVDRQFREHRVADFVASCDKNNKQWPRFVSIAAVGVSGEPNACNMHPRSSSAYCVGSLMAEAPTYVSGCRWCAA